MKEPKKIRLPISAEDLAGLRAGEPALLTGTLFTSRDAAHKRLVAALENGEALPVDLRGNSVYYTGPCPARPGEAIGSCGPTTSSRMDTLTVPLLEAGLKVMIGKGKRSEEVVAAMRRCGAVYFAAVGGAGALYADSVVSCRLVAYPELLSEAVYELTVRDFPVLTAVDCRGNSVYSGKKPTGLSENEK